MDFVKFYIIQLVKNAASRIRVTDKDKELLLSRLVSKIENCQEIFPELKMMERVVELEEAASKLISIYRRLNKSHIDLEKISYHFISDRDAIQSILRRFIQGNFQTGLINKKRPKIVFDDTTFTIYELKESQQDEPTEIEQPEIKQSRIDIREFLKEEKEEIISVKLSGSLPEDLKVNLESEVTNQPMDKEEKLEIDDGIVKKSSSEGSKKSQKTVEDLILPLEFETKEEKEYPKSEDEKPGEKSAVNIELQLKESDSNLEELSSNDEMKLLEESQELTETSKEKVTDDSNFNGEVGSTLEGENDNKSPENEITEEQSLESEFSETEVIERAKSSVMDEKYLEFEKLVLENILEVDDYLNRIKSEQVDDAIQLRIIQKAYNCFELAKDLQFELISEMIKVYWAAIVAIRDYKLKITKDNIDLIRSTLISLTALIRQRDIDLEPFLKKYNQLKTELKSLQYEV